MVDIWYLGCLLFSLASMDWCLDRKLKQDYWVDYMLSGTRGYYTQVACYSNGKISYQK